jgi:hypothetical protein
VEIKSSNKSPRYEDFNENQLNLKKKIKILADKLHALFLLGHYKFITEARKFKE